MEEYDDNSYPWQKGQNLLSFNDKSETPYIYPSTFKGCSYVDCKYVYPVDVFMLKIGVK